MVTGATAGIGREVALRLVALGAEVVVHGRSAERGAKTVQEIHNAGVYKFGVTANTDDAFFDAILQATGGQRAIAP